MELIKTDKVLKMCGVCYKTIKKWQNKNGFPKKLEGTNRFNLDDVLDWIEKRSKNCYQKQENKDKKISDPSYYLE